MAIIKLKSSDDKVFAVDVKVAQLSMTIKTMLDDLGFTEEDEEEPIPLPNVNGDTLARVIEWAEHHKDDAPYVEDENKEKRTDDIDAWDQEFLKIEHNTLFELILAANYLDIKALLDVTCKTVASMIKGKTPEEIRKTFNYNKDTAAQSTEEGDAPVPSQPSGNKEAKMETAA